ncbi:hypothetical protein [Hoeflea sp.]
MVTFRVHFAGGTADVTAKTPNDARDVFAEKNPGVIIKKVKVVK